MIKKLLYLISFVLVVSLANSVSAAAITWGDAFDVVGPEDVIATGMLHEAVNGSSVAGEVVVNGVTFTNSNDLLDNSTGANFLAGSTTGDAAYDEIIGTLDFGGGISTTISMGGGTLTPGVAYLVQVWFTDLRAAQMNRVMSFGDGLGNTVDVHASGAGLGQYAVGTFTADAGSQTLSLITNGFGNAHFTAYQVRTNQPNPYASGPGPKDGTLHEDTWVSLAWTPGAFAVSHDVYLGENFDDVNEGTRDSDVFRGNITDTFIIPGIPGNPYPDGLVNGTTYYWRIDEVNDAEPNSPWKGNVWSFSIPPKTAYTPIPADAAEFVSLNVKLTWTPGFGAKLHYVVFGEDFDEVNNTPMGTPTGPATYNPGSLKLAKTYYWRIDEFDGTETHKGEVWSFTTEGAVSGPNPADGAVDVKPSVVLGWDAGAVAASHEVYFGTDADAVANATTASPEYKGPKALGEESYDPGILSLNTTYFWRIDEVNGVSPDSPWAGNVWSFTTGDFFVIDDFETYDANDNQIWYAWHDGLGAGSPGTPGYIPPNGTGSVVGDDTTASYTEETIVHGGSQSMPLAYNNQQSSGKYSELEHTLPNQRDWTADGVTELSLWFRGNPASVGSFTAAPTGTITMTGSGTDVWGTADQFHFAYKTLTGVGSIVAKVESVENTNVWAKAGVMIRETLDAGSKHAFACVTPGSGVSSQSRPDTDAASLNTNQTGITAPHWVKLERSISGTFTVSHSANGSTWEPVTGATPQNISMTSNAYIGLALSSHNAALTCQAVFSNVTTTGNVSGQWANQDIGIASNDAEPLYVAVSNTAGTSAVVAHDDPAASQIGIWTPWVIPLQAFADKGIVLTNVDRIAIGLGTRGNMTTPGGSGKMYIDDIRLYRPRESAEE